MPSNSDCTPGCELKPTNVRVQALSISQIKLNPGPIPASRSGRLQTASPRSASPT
jgi:hypothetical protein